MSLRWLASDPPLRQQIGAVGQLVVLCIFLNSLQLHPPLAAIIYIATVWFGIAFYNYRLQRQSQQRVADAKDRQKTLFIDSIFAPIALPVFAREEWKQMLADSETELTVLGFRRLLYFQNSTYTSAGEPNFTAVYVSPDETIAAALNFLARPHPVSGELQRGFSTLCFSEFPGPRWLTTVLDRGKTWTPTTSLHFHFVPAACTLIEQIAGHDARLRSPEWSGQEPKKWISPDAYLEAQRQLHAYICGKPGADQIAFAAPSP